MTSTLTALIYNDIKDLRETPNIKEVASIALQSQYSHSRIYKRLCVLLREELDASAELQQVFDDVMNPKTAKGEYLDWWGQRVGVDRYIQLPSGEYVRFDDEYFRFLIFYRALANISNGSSAAINDLFELLTDAVCFVVDYQDMTINSLVMIGDVSDLQATILSRYGILNRPAGVKTNLLVIYPDEKIFGFEGSELDTFDQGPFNHSRQIDLT